jgi:5-enolpyruvylshikimate-3-phosphate synthase
MNFKSHSSRLVALAAVAAIGLSMSNASFARDVTQPTGDTSKAGGACTVTTGSNKGKTGTYENDEGSLYCSGSGWSTGCVTSGGVSQCKDAAMTGGTVIGRLPVYKAGSFSFMR